MTDDIRLCVTLEYVERVNRLLIALTKNASHCFGVDFYDLNEALIETGFLLRVRPASGLSGGVMPDGSYRSEAEA